MKFFHHVKAVLFQKIKEMAQHPEDFSVNPGVDFTRSRKIDFSKLIHLLLRMESGTIKKELLDFFSFHIDTPTASAFIQQRDKLLPEALYSLFMGFNREFDDFTTFQGYRLIACDGSELSIPHNPSDKDTYTQTRKDVKGYNLLHLHAFYDLCSKRYTDVKIEPKAKYNECDACISMMGRSSIKGPRIIIADRNYECYNLIEHANTLGWKYLIRAKDLGRSGILSKMPLPQQDTFDVDVTILMTRQQTNEIKAHPETYKFMPSCQKFDFLKQGEKGVYLMKLRVIRLKLTEDTYEVLITNLDRDEFPPEKLKGLYNRRWGIETSFRELKHAIGLASFHSKKVSYIKQEIYTRLLLYNFCEIITMHVVIEQKERKHSYQINFTVAIQICKFYLKCLPDVQPPDVEGLISKNLLPVREGRYAPRNVKTQPAVSFNYRLD